MQKILLFTIIGIHSFSGRCCRKPYASWIMGSNHHVNAVGLGTPDSARSNAEIDKPG